MIRRENTKDILPLTPMQLGMMVHAAEHPESRAYYEQIRCELRGRVDVEALFNAWREVVARHDALRAAFVDRGAAKPLQVILHKRDPELRFIDLRHDDDVQSASLRHAEEELARPFALGRDALLRVLLLQSGAETFELIWTHHHISIDGWCAQTVLDEVVTLYGARVTGTPAQLRPAVSYSRYFEWLRNTDEQRAVAHWSELLRGFETLTPFPARAAVRRPAERCNHRFEFSVAESRALEALAAQLEITLAALMQTMWGVLLARHCDANDVVFGVTVSGRPASLQSVQQMVGLFINTIPARLRLEDRAFADLARAVHRQSIEGEPHAIAPLAAVQVATGRAQLFDHVFLFQNYPSAGERLIAPGVQIGAVAHSSSTNYDVVVAVAPGERIAVELSYDGGAFDPGTMERIGSRWRTLAAAVLRDANASARTLPILANGEREELLALSSGQRRDVPYRSVVAMIAERVASDAEAVALVFEESALTYRQLDEASNRVARMLQREYGAAPEECVVLHAGRSHLSIVGMLGVLKTGAAYAPVDAIYPRERIEFIAANCSAKAILTATMIEEAMARESAEPLGLEPRAETLAYVMHTSGSTGEPKGVMVEHRNLSSMVLTFCDEFQLATRERVNAACVSPFVFDASVASIYCSLVLGHPLYLIADELRQDGREVVQFLRRNGIEYVDVAPALLPMMLAGGLDEGRAPRLIMVGGEALTRAVAAATCRDRDVVLLNAYGPTETCMASTTRAITASSMPDEEAVPIGRPCVNEQTYVLDRNLSLVPHGCEGEIWIGGECVARGYLNRDDLTAERFVADPFTPGGRLYRTGDRGRWSAAGELLYLGRADQQVKLRGYRIELGEIEAQLRREPAVRDAAVLLDSEMLIAFIAADAIDEAALRDTLAMNLPHYMLPSRILTLDALPVTTSGKVDRRRLLAIAAERQASVDSEAVPRSRTEAAMLVLWQQVLGSRDISVDDDFFAAGGHSLVAMQLVSAIQRELQVDVTVRDVFANATAARLAALVKRKERSAFAPLAPAPEAVDYPLSHAQLRLWLDDRARRDSTSYSISSAYVVRNADLTRLRKTFDLLIARHESLRTNFIERGGEPRQVIHPPAPLDVDVIDLRSVSDGERLARQIAEGESARPFDLACDRLVRVRLLRLDEERTVLLMTLHHIISDGWSMRLLASDLSTLYRGATLPALPLQYKDYAAWDRARDLASEEKTWLERAAQIERLPLGDGNPDAPPDAAARETATLASELLARLREVAAARRTTLGNFVLAAFGVLLARAADRERVAIATTVANRGEHPDLEHVVGFFVNLVLDDIAVERGATFASVLERVVEASLDAFERPSYPFDLLLSRVAEQRRVSVQSLVNVGYAYQRLGAATPGLDIEPWGEAGAGGAKFDLLLTVDDGDDLRLSIDYRRRALAPEAARAIVGALVATLARVAENVDLPVNAIEAPPLGAQAVHAASAAEVVLERSPLEAPLLQIAARTLDLDDLTRDDDFFEVGGHSLRAMQYASAVNKQLGLNLAVRDVFEFPTIAQLASVLEKRGRSTAAPILPAPELPHYPLSYAQKRLWIAERYAGASAAYNMAGASRCAAWLDVTALEASFTALSERHEALRTNFIEVDGEPRQVIRPAAPFHLEVVDLSAEADSLATAERLAAEEARTPIDLTRDPLVRAKLLRLADGTHILLTTLHHIIGDGWSMQLLKSELAALYEAISHGRTPALAPLGLQYKDYAYWEQHVDFSAHERYWSERLGGRIELVRLPTAAGAATGDLHGGTESMTIDPAIAAGLRATATLNRTTLANVVLAVFYVFLHKISEQPTLTVAMSVANRSHHPELESLAGFFVNSLPLRVEMPDSGDFGDVLAQVVARSLEALEHQAYPFDLLVQKLAAPRGADTQHVANVSYAFQNFGDVAFRRASPETVRALGLDAELEQALSTSKFDLTLFAADSPAGLYLSFEYSSRVFTAATARRYLGAMARFLESVASSTPAPDRVAEVTR